PRLRHRVTSSWTGAWKACIRCRSRTPPAGLRHRVANLETVSRKVARVSLELAFSVRKPAESPAWKYGVGARISLKTRRFMKMCAWLRLDFGSEESSFEPRRGN